MGRFGLAGAGLDAGQPENAADWHRKGIRLKPDGTILHQTWAEAPIYLAELLFSFARMGEADHD